jgi:uncharacterized protein YukE
MPTWSPDWSDVSMDVTAVRVAATECRAVAGEIAEWTFLTTDSVLAAHEHWLGGAADELLAEFGRWRQDGTQTSDDLVDVARRLDAAADAALMEQAHRLAERERWFRELAAENAQPVPTPVAVSHA